jgi:hypothetical protein
MHYFAAVVILTLIFMLMDYFVGLFRSKRCRIKLSYIEIEAASLSDMQKIIDMCSKLSKKEIT